MVKNFDPFHSTCEDGFAQGCITHDVVRALCTPRTFGKQEEGLATHGGVGKLLQRTQQSRDDLIAATLGEEYGLGERDMGTLDWRSGSIEQGRQQALSLVKQAKLDVACYQRV